MDFERRVPGASPVLPCARIAAVCSSTVPGTPEFEIESAPPFRRHDVPAHAGTTRMRTPFPAMLPHLRPVPRPGEGC